MLTSKKEPFISHEKLPMVNTMACNTLLKLCQRKHHTNEGTPKLMNTVDNYVKIKVDATTFSLFGMLVEAIQKNFKLKWECWSIRWSLVIAVLQTIESWKWKNCSVSFLEYVTISKNYWNRSNDDIIYHCCYIAHSFLWVYN
jgi:hypothetical protein